MIKLTEEWVEKAKSVHGDRYDYSLVNYLGNKIKIRIICLIHGEYIQTPNNHLNKRGCPKCGGTKKLTQKEFIEKSILKHGDRYDYSKSIYSNNNGKVEIICKEHGLFFQMPTKHIISGHGCPKCGGTEKLTQEEFIVRGMKIHNQFYDYSFVKYKNYNTKVVIICPKHGKFLQTVDVHLSGCGCPKCKKSKGENRISNFLEKNMIYYITEYTFDDCRNQRPLRFDFYLPKQKILIEYDGEQHFFEKNGWKNKLSKIMQNDKIKNEYVASKEIPLIRIPYTKQNEIEVILENNLMKLTDNK